MLRASNKVKCSIWPLMTCSLLTDSPNLRLLGLRDLAAHQDKEVLEADLALEDPDKADLTTEEVLEVREEVLATVAAVEEVDSIVDQIKLQLSLSKV